MAGDLLKEHPAFKTSAQVLTDMYREQMIAPEFCREAMRREVRNQNQGKCEDDPIVKDEAKRKFPDVERQFKVISSNTLTVIIDEDLLRRLKDRVKRKEVCFQELQQKAVNIYTSKEKTYGVAPLDVFSDLYYWTLEYDDFLGYMAGVLKLTNFADNCYV